MRLPLDMVDHEATNPVRTSEMTFRVLEGLESLQGATLTELANHLSEPKSTVHNHLSTLLENRYLVRHGDWYYLGLRFTELGEQCKNRHDIYSIGKEPVDTFAAETGELVNLAIEEHGHAVYLHQVSGENAISTDTFVGKRVYMHCTALGKAMLAFMSRQRVSKILDQRGLPAQTRYTITDRADLIDSFDEIRDREIAFDDEERGYGVCCIGAPIRYQEVDEVIGAVSVSMPVNSSLEERFKEELPKKLKSLANIIEIELTYSG